MIDAATAADDRDRDAQRLVASTKVAGLAVEAVELVWKTQRDEPQASWSTPTVESIPPDHFPPTGLVAAPPPVETTLTDDGLTAQLKTATYFARFALYPSDPSSTGLSGSV